MIKEAIALDPLAIMSMRNACKERPESNTDLDHSQTRLGDLRDAYQICLTNKIEKETVVLSAKLAINDSYPSVPPCSVPRKS